MAKMNLSAQKILPLDNEAVLVGRAWLPGPIGGPSPVTISDGAVFDLSRVAATCAGLLNANEPVSLVSQAIASGRALRIGSVADVLANSDEDTRDSNLPHFLAPPDLQAIKACGVTFVDSMLERVIEELAKGDPVQAETIRASIGAEIGASLSSVKPGSAEAEKVKASLLQRGLWSQYLEVGIGPDAEIFTKSQPMSAVGPGAHIGIHPASHWNNPEPELVLAVNKNGKVVGATLGNDVNLRDFEGRSALLLGRGKDNNASCALGPFIRLLDSDFGIDALRGCAITIEVHGDDGFALRGVSDLRKISRDMLDLVSQAINRHHQYPDGLMLFLGTMFAPTQDRGQPGQGFTHHPGDVVTIHSPRLGTLENRVKHTDKIAPWTFGVAELISNLAQRNLLS